ncbi:RibD family protein [Halomonas sp. ML-15]|uniref:RibD family protein n=1 Tax=Halomonas sp. ML-15 TaxID=2773305 RepID=UPI0017475A2A|nr:RibD family protein [Halomonas sp. ML-15]MBD3898287.1 RibD family protein [Halomonas sp. ML-15]
MSEAAKPPTPRRDDADLAFAWKALLTARDHSWEDVTELVIHRNSARLTLHRGGHWHAEPALDSATAALLDSLLPLVCDSGPRVIAQLGQSLDGRIATHSGHSHYINGFESRVHLHRLRALVDAVLVGAGTADEDDPQLNVRHIEGRQPLRVVLDPRGRVPVARRVFQDPTLPTLHLLGEGMAPPVGVGAHVGQRWLARDAEGRVAPQAVIDALQQAGCRRVLIEGGGQTVSQFIAAGCVDRLHLLVAPLLIGSGRPGLTLPLIDTLDQALRPSMRRFDCGDDTLFDIALRASVG